ncbi:MAG TPA: hypothetical protein VGS02_17080 [Acidobacteriaceae bacterium]|nr:hypothetical protein [Acidobacteriaceae bacterium]
MTNQSKALATLALSLAVATGYAQTAAGTTQGTRAVHHRTRAASPRVHTPSVQSQIEELKNQMQEQKGQIDSLRQQLSDRDAQLEQAQQAAQQAQQAAQAAQQAATAEQQTLSSNTQAVSSLQTSVNDLKSSNTELATSVKKQTDEVKKAVESPDAIHFKGITLSPSGSFLAAETVWRHGATGGDINTPFTSVPLDHSDNAQLSEFFGSGRQSRVAMKAVGKTDHVVYTGYYEADFLSAGITSNNNQSNSYTLRQRQLWGDALVGGSWDFSGGTGWSLVTETTQGETRGTEVLPATIDAQYTAGFVWGRQYSFRVTKDFAHKFWAGLSVENAETLNPAGSNLPTNLLIGSAGTGGGLYNSTANYSFNYTPDFVGKLVFQPKYAHIELFGIERNFRDRVYTSTTSSAGAFNSSATGAGIGGGFRTGKKVVVGLKGLYGKGVGRYGSSTIADVTLRPDGEIDPLKAFSALSTLEFNPSGRLNVYFNYGGDYVYRHYNGKEGYGSPLTNMSGCLVEPVAGTATVNGGVGFSPANPANCGNQNKDVQEFTMGDWYYFYKGPKGGLRFGLQYARFERDLWSGAGGAANPGGGAKGVDNMFWTSWRYYLP